MDRCHDLLPAQAPPAPAVCAPLPARPNHGAADFPAEPGAAAEVLGADPLAAYFYPGLVEDTALTLREALFGAYLYDFAGFGGMLGLAERAAQVELAASTDPTRAGQLGGLPARIAAGKAALAAAPEPFELDVLLGADPGRVVGLVTGLFADHAHTLAERLRERAAGDPVLTQRAERLIALVQGTEEGSLWQGGLDLTASGADALWGIAARHLGDGARHNEIAALNGLEDADPLCEGQILLPTNQSPTCERPSDTLDPVQLLPECSIGDSDGSWGFAQALNPVARWVVDSLAGDWAGKEILRRYLANGGDWSIVDDPAWTEYLQDSMFLRVQTNEELTRIVADLLPMVDDECQVFGERVHMAIENGERAVGYQYLHGTNADDGDFEIEGQALASPDAEGQLLTVTGRCTWNDVIDPNPRYDTDTLKSLFAEIITLGSATPYDLSISWGYSCTMKAFPDQGFIVILDGWPGVTS